MKTSLIILLMLFSSFSLAQCQKAADQYGNGEGVDSIPSECRAGAEKLSQQNARKHFTNAKVSIVGHKNILYVNDQVFAGESTMLRDVIAVAFDEKNAEVAALESSGDILVFNAKIPGNVAPVRVIRHQDLDGASDINFLSTTEEIAVHISSQNEILTFSRLANFFGREGHKRLAVRRQILNAKKLPEQ